MNLFLDLETFCETPINAGTHRYAEKAEVLLTAFAIDDGPPFVREGLPAECVDLIGAADEIIIHNSRFDRTVLGHQGVAIPIPKVHDTMARARAHSLPGGLGPLCDVLGVPSDKAKDKAGKQLIQLFCKPRPKTSAVRRATKATHPVEWQRFIEYAGLDIVSMREVYKRLPMWNYGGRERELWWLDQGVNDRGFAVDLDLTNAAIATVERERARLAKRVFEMTDGEVEAATQRDKLLAHLLAQYGVDLPDMQKGTLERRLTDPDLPEPVRELIAIRLEAAGMAVSKYKALLKSVSSDGRLRGALEWCGAARTGRWSGRLFQPQNLPRPKFKRDEIEQDIANIKLGVADLVYEDSMARASSALRGCIVAPPGRKIVAADLSNIEGRVIAWLAGEEWKLEAFRQFDIGVGHDLYKVGAGRILGKSPEGIDGVERQNYGKVPELACNYQGALGAFQSMAQLYGLDLADDHVLRIVKGWRAAHPAIVSFWYGLEARAVEAVRYEGKTFDFGKLKLRRDGAWLRIVLPSGRALCYPSPRIEPPRPCRDCDGIGKMFIEDALEDCLTCRGRGKLAQRLTYMGMNQYTRRWERIDTYGGKLAENVTQAASRDVMARNMPAMEAAGFELVLTVHDEAICEVDEDGPGAAELVDIMATNPPWADGLPLAANGFAAQRYGKED